MQDDIYTRAVMGESVHAEAGRPARPLLHAAAAKRKRHRRAKARPQLWQTIKIAPNHARETRVWQRVEGRPQIGKVGHEAAAPGALHVLFMLAPLPPAAFESQLVTQVCHMARGIVGELALQERAPQLVL